MADVYFDASRLFLRGGRSSPTGIDRVVFAYARWLRARDHVRLTPVWSRMGYLSRLPLRQFDAILDRVAEHQGSPASGAVWTALVAALQHPGDHPTGLRPRRQAALAVREIRGYAGAGLSALASQVELRLARGALFVNVNHYGLEHPRLLERLVGAGVRPAVLIHDLIPISFPEYCSPGAAARHERRVEQSLRHAETLIANSASTACELDDFAATRGLAPRHCTVAPLGLEPSFADAAPIEAPPYFVCVGTIEPRKNLGFLLSLWRRLAARLGPDTPRLVVIGRRGWETEAVVDQLERSPAVLKYVHEVSNLRDDQVARLIRGAAALLSPSFAEGYNLPVIEALSLSTPVIASDIAVHRELAVGAQLIDPLDGPAWLEALLAAHEHRPRSPAFLVPTWEAHFDTVARALGLA
jgi:glycosyltransferase involved in cell wall biosynthesis